MFYMQCLDLFLDPLEIVPFQGGRKMECMIETRLRDDRSKKRTI